jgi:hypothetical protein
MSKRKIIIPIIIITVAVLALYWPIHYVIARNLGSSENPQKQIIPLTDDLSRESSFNPAAQMDSDSSVNNLAPTPYTPDTYIKPVYDPFQSDTPPGVIDEILPQGDPNNASPQADFTVRTDTRGIASRNSGTIGSTFIFNASTSTDGEDYTSKLKARWDFDGDNHYDTYFSRTKTAYHRYERPGTYNLMLQILDTAGNTDTTTQQVIVVNNTPPLAFFSYKPQSAGTPETIYLFDTSRSSDSQYGENYLQYRFDWNGDGKWDTTYQFKKSWRHKFEAVGVFNVTMEVKDPEGSTAKHIEQITINPNSIPYADFTIEVKEQFVNGEIYRTYVFDASASYDPETPQMQLQYRWDFNYTGPDDISFNLDWSNSYKYTGTYQVPGEKIIRLQVRDQDGAVNEVYKTIYVGG